MKFLKMVALWLSMTGLYAIAMNLNSNNNNIIEYNEIVGVIVITLLYFISWVIAIIKEE